MGGLFLFAYCGFILAEINASYNDGRCSVLDHVQSFIEEKPAEEQRDHRYEIDEGRSLARRDL